MKLALILSTLLLAGCQTMDWKEGYDPTYDMMMLQQSLQPQPAFQYVPRTNINCRSYRAGTQIYTNCW